MQATMEQARSLIATIQTIAKGNDDNIHATIENLRVATGDLAQLSDGLKDRPWSLVRIRQPKDRKVPEPNSSLHSRHQPIDILQEVFVVRELDG